MHKVTICSVSLASYFFLVPEAFCITLRVNFDLEGVDRLTILDGELGDTDGIENGIIKLSNLNVRNQLLVGGMIESSAKQNSSASLTFTNFSLTSTVGRTGSTTGTISSSFSPTCDPENPPCSELISGSIESTMSLSGGYSRDNSMTVTNDNVTRASLLYKSFNGIGVAAEGFVLGQVGEQNFPLRTNQEAITFSDIPDVSSFSTSGSFALFSTLDFSLGITGDVISLPNSASFNIKRKQVPEPLTIFSIFTTIGFGALFKKKKLSSKAQ